MVQYLITPYLQSLVKQVSDEYQTKRTPLASYLIQANELLDTLDNNKIEHIPREKNVKA